MPTNAEIHAAITLYITGQRSHILNNTVAQIFHDMVDNIGLGGGASIIDITYANLLTAISGSTLTAGATYKITDRGDRGIYLQAISTNQLSKIGTRLMLCPAFYGTGANGGNIWIGVWNATKNPNIGDLTIWGGLVWESVTGNIGTADSDILLDAVNWAVIPKASFSNGEYIEMQFGVSYDIENDWIERQWDGNGNIFGRNFMDNGNNPNDCDMSDWNFSSANPSDRMFYNNNCFGVFNNLEHKDIYSNNCLRGYISNNINNGHITGNVCVFGISGNSNGGNIIDNVVFAITNNSNTNKIWDNNFCNYIDGNSNNGEIGKNTIGGTILNNSNDGEVMNNMCSERIEGNSNLGHIRFNINNGHILNCSSGEDPCEIHHNINNGSISGTFAADVTDTIVDKN